MDLAGFRQFGGAVPELSALRRVMVFHRAICRQTSEAPSEAMLFGLAGGPGFSYVDAPPGGVPTLRLGPSYNNRPGELVQHLCVRMGLPASFRHTADPALARRNLARALEQGDPVIVYAPPGRLPWLLRQDSLALGEAHPVVIFGLDDDGAASVSDVAPGPLRLASAALDDARAALGSPHNLSVVVAPPSAAIDLPRCIDAGVRSCYERLLEPPHPRYNHGVGAIARLAVALGDVRDATGWLKLTPRGAPLLAALCATFQALTLDGRDPDAGRGLYASFLRESAVVLQDTELGDVATRYDALASAWRNFGAALLPDEVPAFAEIRSRIVDRESALRSGVDDATRAAGVARLREALTVVGADFPLSESATRKHLGRLRDELSAIAGQEEEAARVLRLARR